MKRFNKCLFKKFLNFFSHLSIFAVAFFVFSSSAHAMDFPETTPWSDGNYTYTDFAFIPLRADDGITSDGLLVYFEGTNQLRFSKQTLTDSYYNNGHKFSYNWYQGSWTASQTGTLFSKMQYANTYNNPSYTDCWAGVLTTKDIVWTNDYNYGNTDYCGNVWTPGQVVVARNINNDGTLINPEPSANSVFSAQFMYPTMYGPFYHADMKMPDLTSSVPVRVKIGVPSDVDADTRSHIQAYIVRMVDGTYSLIDTGDPFLESHVINTSDEFGNINFQAPLFAGMTEYYAFVLAYDDTYVNQHGGTATILRYYFSLTGLGEDDPNYQYGQSPIAPPIDSDGNTGASTGSVMGDWLRDLFVPSDDFMASAFNGMNYAMREQFADFFTFYDSVKSAQATAFVNRFAGNVVYNNRQIAFSVNPFSNVPDYVPVITSLVAYASFAFFLVRKIPEILSA